MASIRTSFEKELRYKLGQKATPHQGEENILLRSFKYFDLNNSGTVDREEFLKTIEKIGIQIFNKQDFFDLFDYYDLDKDGSLNYTEFTSILFGNQSGTTRKMNPGDNTGVAYSKSAGIEGMEEAVEKFRRKLKERGGTGILGLGRQFRIFDDDNSRGLNRAEFIKACKDFQVDVNDNDMQKVFDYFDRNRDGDINYDEFLLGMRGPMNNFRKNLVGQAFAKLDKDGSGVVTTDDLVGVYNAKLHPDVRAGKKTENQIFQEFLTTFEAYSDIQGINDGKITKEEFIDYYTFISASIDNDQYFELMINNAWRINDGANKNWEKKGWADTIGGKQGDGNLQKGYQDFAKSKPQQQQQPRTPIKSSAQQGQPQAQQGGNKATEFESIMQRVRAKLATRGTRGFIGIQRQFKIMDDNNDKAISYQEFTKAMRDYKIELTEREVKIIFDEIDRDNSGNLSIDELVRAIQGEMNSFRRGVINQVFNKLDKDGDGVIRVNDIKGIYNAKNHPDVKSGKKSEDEILGEFLETFEMHHNLKSGMRDQNVTREEFLEYYNNVSANIDNDQYFELMIVNSYKLYDSVPQYQQYAPAGGRKDVDVKAGWSQDYSGQFKSKTTANAPFGTSDVPTEYSTNLRPQSSAQNRRELEKKAAGAPTQGVANIGGVKESLNQGNQSKPQSRAVEDLVEDLRGKLQQRGVRGIFSLGRLFRNIDDDNSRSINLPEFTKVCNEFRMDYSQRDLQAVFNYIDVNKNGEIDYDEFLRMIRGQMNEARKKWVQMAFNKLDRNGNGVVNLDDIRGVYNAKSHPDVLSGKKNEEEVLGEFLDTFEVHHANLTGDSRLRDKNVTMVEFVEYYNNISASIDDDRYFELMMRNAWNFDNVKYQKGWAADVGKKF